MKGSRSDQNPQAARGTSHLPVTRYRAVLSNSASCGTALQVSRPHRHHPGADVSDRKAGPRGRAAAADLGDVVPVACTAEVSPAQASAEVVLAVDLSGTGLRSRCCGSSRPGPHREPLATNCGWGLHIGDERGAADRRGEVSRRPARARRLPPLPRDGASPAGPRRAGRRADTIGRLTVSLPTRTVGAQRHVAHHRRKP